LAISYDVKPSKVSNYPHLEIAAIFLAYCNSYFLTEKGKLAFVLPRSFFNADHHDNTRSGKAKGFKIIDIWDLNNVSPLFRIPSCVLFTKRTSDKRSLKISGIKGLSFSGNLPSNNCNSDIAKDKLSLSELTWYYVRQGNSSAFSNRKPSKKNLPNPYKGSFKQGATIVPRSFYFVELNQEKPEDYEDRILSIKTTPSVKAESKPPWNGLDFSNRIESKFLFRTALSKSVLPFAIINPEMVVLPIEIKINSERQKEIVLHSSASLMNLGYLNASRWFSVAENIWDISKTEKSKNMTTLNRLDFQRGLSDQNLNVPYLVLYTSSSKDANATVVERSTIDLEFIVESKTYVFYTLNKDEAFYLVSVLNSKIPNALMKDFQTKGLFGARDVHKKILDVYFPKYSYNDPLQTKLSELGSIASSKISQYINLNPPQNELSSIHLGRYRITIKNHISKEMAEIDKIVKKLLK
jgi:hypothetical protein